MSGPELPGKLQFTVSQIHRNYGIGPSDRGGANRREADTASTEYGDPFDTMGANPNSLDLEHIVGFATDLKMDSQEKR